MPTISMTVANQFQTQVPECLDESVSVGGRRVGRPQMDLQVRHGLPYGQPPDSAALRQDAIPCLPCPSQGHRVVSSRRSLNALAPIDLRPAGVVIFGLVSGPASGVDDLQLHD